MYVLGSGDVEPSPVADDSTPDGARDRPRDSPRVRAQRSDARRNQAAVVDAAQRVFAAQGPHAPLAAIAQEAGVGRSTLQRHFPDRYALAAAVYDRNLDAVERYAAAHADRPGLLDEMVRRIVRGQRGAAGLFPLMRAVPEAAAQVDRLGERLAALLAPVVEGALARGEVAPGTTTRDVQLVLSMAEGLLVSYDGDERDAALARGVELALSGLRG